MDGENEHQHDGSAERRNRLAEDGQEADQDVEGTAPPEGSQRAKRHRDDHRHRHGD